MPTLADILSYIETVDANRAEWIKQINEYSRIPENKKYAEKVEDVVPKAYKNLMDTATIVLPLLKSLVQEKNVAVADKMAELSATQKNMAFMTGLVAKLSLPLVETISENTYNGTTHSYDVVNKESRFKNALSLAEVRKDLKELQLRYKALQIEIHQHNHTTIVELPEGFLEKWILL